MTRPFALLFALVALASAFAPGASAFAAQPFDPFKEARIDEHPGARIPLDGQLADQAGHATSLRAIAGGKVLVLTPVLHECPNICGVTLAGVADAAGTQKHLVAGRDFVLVAFGIDPAEKPADAEADLARLRRQRPGKPVPFVATVGGAQQVRAVTGALGYHYAYDPRIRQFAHSAATAVLTPDGRLARWIYGLAPDPVQLGAAISDARAGRTGGFVQQVLLLCYHYDPQTGTYSLLIDKVVRMAGIATVLAIGLLVLLLRRKTA